MRWSPTSRGCATRSASRRRSRSRPGSGRPWNGGAGTLTVEPPRIASSPMPRVSLAVLNYDGRELLEVVLPSLAAQEFTDFETIVIDNASHDDSLAYLQEHWPDVRVVSVGRENVGVSAALNVAVRSARGELVALLNNDIELEPSWLGELVAALDRHPDAVSVAGKLLSFSARDRIYSAGDIFTTAPTPFPPGAPALAT